MQKIKYSFVQPAYKARFFREALDSILAQTYRDFELIIVNDASPEDLDSIVKSYDDPRIRYYVNEQNIGGKDLVAQWNHCLEYAEGEYVILASDDDIYFPQYLEKMDALVQKYPDVNVFRPRVQLIDSLGSVISAEKQFQEYNTISDFVRMWVLGKVCSGVPFYCIRKDALIKNGCFVCFPMAWFSDDATIISLASSGVVNTSDILFSFRLSGESITTRKETFYSLAKKLEATEMFYSWFKRNFITKQLKESPQDYRLLADISELFQSFLFNNKIKSQIQEASFVVVFLNLPRIILMKCITVRQKCSLLKSLL